jgi:hypothetical protein
MFTHAIVHWRHVATGAMACLAAACFAVACLAVACTGDGLPEAPTQTISIGLSSISATVHPGSSATTTVVTISGTGGYKGPPVVTTLGVPVGVVSSISGIGTTANTSVGIITLSAAVNAVPGTYAIVVQAAGSGVATVTTTFTLTVN